MKNRRLRQRPRVSRLATLLPLVTISALPPSCGVNSPSATVLGGPAPCVGVYAQAQNACVARSGCAGFACLLTESECAPEGQRALDECCLTDHNAPADRARCEQTMGSMP